jgi:uncharacterized membrane protein YgcG
MKLRSLLAGAVVLGLVALVATAAPRSVNVAAANARIEAALAAADLRPSSAVTVSSAAAGIKVTVSQTTNLVNQAIDISWSGAPATIGTPNFKANYLQIMQCWGDTTPTRDQCEFGGKVAFDTRGGDNNTASRLLTQAPLDPKEPLTKTAVSAYVPFQPVSGNAVTGIDVLKNPYYDQSTSNEIPFASTRGDGKGFASFEAQTFREASGLGCGNIAAKGAYKGKIAPCWLVIVPRSSTEVDGTNQAGFQLSSSPLSTTNWDKRIVVQLKFAPAAQVCPISAQQRAIVGSEPVAEAVSRWQPALCKNKGPVFSYSQTAEAAGRRTLLSPKPGMVMMTAPVPPSQVPADRILTYAPVSISGISIAVMIERLSPIDAPVATKAQDGERITDLNLTPRLVAKLLTQSYVLNVSGKAKYLKANPINLTSDPEFLAINPEFKSMFYRDSIETLAPIGLGDAYSAIWRWIAADPDARDFVAGLPDRWGMRVNPFYQGIDVPRDDFPKIDPYCDNTVAAGAPEVCTLDQHPYTQDFHDSARSAARGDAQARNLWDATANPPAYKKAPPQLNGERHILGVTDSATAARFGLITAKLRNSAGQFVGPTKAGLTAGLAAVQKTAVSGVVTADPESTKKGAYPLTMVTYAVTAPNILTKAEASDYALFIKYAVGSGQKAGTGLGNLPDGYLPLTSALRKRALAVAKDVQSRRGPAKSGGSDSGNSGSGSGNSGSGGSGGSGSGNGSGSDSPGTDTVTGTPAPTIPVSNGSQANPATAISKATLFTPGDPKVATRYALMIALTLGICALIFGLLLPRLARRLGE